MYKPSSLRAHLTQAVPEFRTDPDKLSLYVRNGTVVSTNAASYSFEYRFTVQLIVLDYAAHADSVMLPLLVWLSLHQPELLANDALRDKSVRFEVEYLNTHTVDLSLELDLTERVIVAPQPGQPVGHFDIRHVAEPPYGNARVLPEHWEFWFKDQKLAEWDHDPRIGP